MLNGDGKIAFSVNTYQSYVCCTQIRQVQYTIEELRLLFPYDNKSGMKMILRVVINVRY